ncbi:Hemolysin-type calcium-binding repeat-containing protein [Nocardioides terrae]|uniref:Hemolysin-type calcium-binding repeat-containing protein n=1 Tax=Nocardioides terrae TaxID=574651 RepID=A0A1I1DG14_9ACTN|nr:hypothetical protein [Nocardioides terrae]SFB73312.1 Hemolysin-type calcium-binding repeat-containing protein [Nocardioides terrae]
MRSRNSWRRTRTGAVAGASLLLAVAVAAPASAVVTVTVRDDGLGKLVVVRGDAADDRVVVACVARSLVVDGTAHARCQDLDRVTVDGGGGSNAVDLSGLTGPRWLDGNIEVSNASVVSGSALSETVRLATPDGAASGGPGDDGIFGGGSVAGGPGSDVLWGGRILDGGPGLDQLMPDPTTGVSARGGQIQIAESVRREGRVWQDGTIPAYVRDRVLSRVRLRPSLATLVGPAGLRHVIRLAAIRGWTVSFQTGRTARARRIDARGMRGPGIGFGGAGRDEILGGAGRDVLAGFAAYDVDDRGISQRSGRDVLRGGRGDDTLRGGRGADRLVGGRGRDLLDCGGGHDVAIADHRDLVRGCEVVHYR